MRARIQVSFDLPHKATYGQAKEYVREAVASWAGSLQPVGAENGDGTYAEGDPMYDLDPQSVRVFSLPYKTRR